MVLYLYMQVVTSQHHSLLLLVQQRQLLLFSFIFLHKLKKDFILMGTQEAVNVVSTKVKLLDPENASKIMSYIDVNLQEDESIHLASSPDHVFHSLVMKVKQHLELSSPSSLNTNPFSLSKELHDLSNNSSMSFPLLSQEYSTDLGSVSKSSHLTTECNTMNDLVDEQKMDDFPFLDLKNEDLDYMGPELDLGHNSHANNVNFGSEEGESYKRCHHFGKGFCKKEIDCKFVHDAENDSVDALVGSPSKFDEKRKKSMANSASASRQIFITFPAKSKFKEMDVSEYFSQFGPVQDVRIPYQKKRTYGFVTFVHPLSVELILSLGDPHFISGSRVLVKPCNEKGKVLDKRQQQLKRGDLSPCLSPSKHDSIEPNDSPLGSRMSNNPHERRKLEEQAELQQALELQGRRLKNLQLPDFKNNPGLCSDSIKEDITEAGPARIHDVENENRKASAMAETTGLSDSVEHVLLDILSSSPSTTAGDNLCDNNKSDVFSTSFGKHFS